MIHKKMLILVFVPLLLASCTRNHPPMPVQELDEKLVLDAIDLSPLPVLAPKPTYLGTEGVLTGPADQSYKVGHKFALVAFFGGYNGGTSRPPNFIDHEAGTISAAGQLTMNLPKDPVMVGNEALNYKQFAEKYNRGTCALNTVNAPAEQENVRLTRFNVEVYGGGTQASAVAAGQQSKVAPLLTPVRNFVGALPFSKSTSMNVQETFGELVFASGDLEIKGELRCASRYVSSLEHATQRNLRIHLQFKKGWNILHIRKDENAPKKVLRIVDEALTGGAEYYTLTAKP